MTPMIAHPVTALAGAVDVPGDKSISHRALILAASAIGESTITGLLEADDVLATAEALRRLGAAIVRSDGTWRVTGRGVGGLLEPDAVLDLGNSGTGARLVMGLAASHPFLSVFAGDRSLSRRPMGRVIEPLQRMGAAVWSRAGGRLPLAMQGTAQPLPIEYALPVASAQVKSAILLAGLNTPGRTTVIEPVPTRDHTERLFAAFGVEVAAEDLPDGRRRITIAGQPELAARSVRVPGDISSAAFPLVAALIVPGSRVTVRGVGINPLRCGLLATLAEMGAHLLIENRRDEGGEPVADIVATSTALTGTDVPPERVPAMIDEFPILAVAAACATGPTRMHGLAELRVKESDRLAAIAEGIAACGIRVDSGADWLVVHGIGAPPAGGGHVRVRFDHRIAMAFLVLGLASRAPVRIDDGSAIRTSFPEFGPLMTALGACIREEPARG
jgi:3-phosphoshikimate 1-carboxyvinyltransferase